MKKSSKAMIAGAAMAGLFAGTFAPHTHAANTGAAGKTLQAPTLEKNACGGKDGCGGKHNCAGKNDCKGQGGCKTGDNGCKGKNTCKGKGGCKTSS